MHLSLFSRLTIGYLTIFLLVAGASTYAIVELGRFSERAESILNVDNAVLEQEKTLYDLLLSISRSEQQFIITKDEVWYLQFSRLKSDFEARLENTFAAGNWTAKSALNRVRVGYGRYLELVDSEARLVRTKKTYPQAQFKKDKDDLRDGVLDDLERLRLSQQQAIYAKVGDLAAVADQARLVSVVGAAVCLLAIVLMSLLMTRSIARPIAKLKNKTREIARGNFDGSVKISSPPEIAELATALNTMSDRLVVLDRLKADFYAYMSHELRTPLTAIKEGTGLLLEGVGGETTEKQRKLLSIIAEESHRLISVVNSLLDLSKMEAGMMSYDIEMTNVEPLIKRAVAELTPLIEAKRIKLERQVELPLPMMQIDPERILQVLRNLLANAVKFTPRGGEVWVRAKPMDGKLEVSVKDSGPGIPAESLASIFEKFSQGAQTGSHQRQGTGLGLAIAKSIISSHGGKIWAESDLGHGSTFVFVLPC